MIGSITSSIEHLDNNMPLGGSIAPRVFSKNLGFAVGGAKDTNNFIENIESGYLPRVSLNNL